MGGAGSSRWGNYQKKHLVDRCTGVIDALQVGEQITVPLTAETEIEIEKPGPATTTALIRPPWGFGINRYLVRCPQCSKPVRKLYLPWPSSAWGCRTCHNLTHLSSQGRSRALVKFMRSRKAMIRGLEARKPSGAPDMGRRLTALRAMHLREQQAQGRTLASRLLSTNS